MDPDATTGIRPDLPRSRRGSLQKRGTPTIVGGRPPSEGDPQSGLPTGIDRVLREAAMDLDFRADLLTLRGKGAARRGFALTPEEVALLDAVPRDQLAAIIDAIPPEPSPTWVPSDEMIGGALADEPELWARYGDKPSMHERFAWLFWLIGIIGIIGLIAFLLWWLL